MKNAPSSLYKNFDEIYSDVLIHNASVHKPPQNFSLDQSIFSSFPPLFIKNALSFILGINSDFNQTLSQPKNLSFFSCLDDAVITLGHLKVVRCLPKFIAENLTNDIIIDMGDLGFVAVTSSNTLTERQSTAVLNKLVSPIINYIFSNELWLPNGKWPRIQSKLEFIFESKKLLLPKEDNSLAFIRLAPQTQEKLEKHGYLGEKTDRSFNLYLPWTFSSKDLDSIEQIISREF